MDATRARRLRDAARQYWYALWRTIRFARSNFVQRTGTARGKK